mgnify:CR=1 FL=1
MKRKVFWMMILSLCVSLAEVQAQIIDVKVIQQDLVQCDTSGLTMMELTVMNNGGVMIYNFADIICTYQIDANPAVVETRPMGVDLYPGDTTTISFLTPFSFNNYTTYSCMYAVDFLADDTAANDTARFDRTFLQPPGYGAHSNDTSICQGDEAYLMMEATGNGPWLLDIVAGTDTGWGIPMIDPVLSTYLTPDSSVSFILLNITDVNGCMTQIGLGITITVNDYPVVDLGPDTTICAGQTFMLDAGVAGADYLWWNGPGAQINGADTSDWNGALGPQYAWIALTLNGCTTRDTVVIDWILCPDGITDQSMLRAEVAPNPSDGMITLTFDRDIRFSALEVFDVQGRRLLQTAEQLTQNRHLKADLGVLPDGLYFILLTGEGNTFSTKVLIQK